jgi:hypothetical protein
VQPITDWLEKLGMPEYAQRFAENGIDHSALRHLTDQDLKDIGRLCLVLSRYLTVLITIGCEIEGFASRHWIQCMVEVRIKCLADRARIVARLCGEQFQTDKRVDFRFA